MLDDVHNIVHVYMYYDVYSDTRIQMSFYDNIAVSALTFILSGECHHVLEHLVDFSVNIKRLYLKCTHS